MMKRDTIYFFHALDLQSMEGRHMGAYFLKWYKMVKTKYWLITSALKKTSAFEYNVPIKNA